jgi:ribulose-5-phosphate 4-epimerase/fuculose-1-phosphate aldolase
MSYEGVKYSTVFTGNSIPADSRIDELRKWCKIFHAKNLAPFYPGGTHGNMSFRVKPGKSNMVITAARTSFAEYLTDDSFFTIESVDFKNLTVHASGASNREPSSETLLHFAIYQQRTDVQAILHGHCEPITKNAEKLNIPTTKEFVESGNMLIVESVLDILENHQFIEIKDHGFLSFGSTITEAGDLAMKMFEKSLEF